MKERVGIFEVDREFLFKGHQDGVNLFNGVSVLHTESNFRTNRMTVTALCDAFREIDSGEVAPYYRAIISTNYDDDGKHTYSVKWEEESR